MLQRILLDTILFLDIETVPEIEHFNDLDASKKELWAQKTAYQRKENFTAEEFYERAGIWAEFGKIVCISLGYFVLQQNKRHFRVTSFFGDELTILKDFKTLLEEHFNKPNHILCAHNGKEFDFPYLARRMLIHGISLPYKLEFFGKKPWEIKHLDTMELWKFGDYKHYTSLNLLANVLGVPSPKEDIDGSQVRQVYYEDKNLDRIVKYCELDVITTAQVFLKMRGDALLEKEDIKNV